MKIYSLLSFKKGEVTGAMRGNTNKVTAVADDGKDHQSGMSAQRMQVQKRLNNIVMGVGQQLRGKSSENVTFSSAFHRAWLHVEEASRGSTGQQVMQHLTSNILDREFVAEALPVRADANSVSLKNKAD